MKIMLEQNNIDPQSSSFGWDGSHHSQTLNPGVYVWMAQYKDCNGNTILIKGDVTLVK